MQTTSDFYHDKMTDMLKLGCAQPNLANICLHKSTDPKLYPLFSSHSDLLEKKKREGMTGGPSIAFTGKSNNLSKRIVGIDASQLYRHSICQNTLTDYSIYDSLYEMGLQSRNTKIQGKAKSNPYV